MENIVDFQGHLFVFSKMLQGNTALYISTEDRKQKEKVSNFLGAVGKEGVRRKNEVR
jgi:hypothetical protein